MIRIAGVVVAIGVCLAGLAGVGRAESVYVTDSLKFSVRAEPGNEQKSVGLVESGQMLELLKPGETWSLVQLPNGAQGYLLSRYLTEQPPARHRFEQVQEKNRNLTQQAAGLLEENTRLKAENEKLAAAAGGHQRETDAVRRDFEAFKKDVADVAALKDRLETLSAELDSKNKEIEALHLKSTPIFQDINLYWFLAGAGVLFVGLLIGFSLKRQRRYSSLS
jgi:SH3 domain protein